MWTSISVLPLKSWRTSTSAAETFCISPSSEFNIIVYNSWGKKITANVYIIWSLVESYLIRISTPFYFHTTVVYRVNLLEIFSLMILFMLSYKILVRLMFLISSGLKEHFPDINIRLLTFCDNRKWFLYRFYFFIFVLDYIILFHKDSSFGHNLQNNVMHNRSKVTRK